MNARLCFWTILATTVAACGGRTDEVAISFPDDASRAATSVLAVTAFEPLMFSPESEVPTFVRCPDIGVFPPTRLVDPDTMATTPNLGRVLTDVRQSAMYPIGEWNVEFPEVKSGNINNPWGAVMVYIEARGEVRATAEQGGGQISATLLAGCYCVRTLEGVHSNRVLDLAVRNACPLVGESQGQAREVPLQPVMPSVFSLAACGVQDLTSPRNENLSPGPEVCASTRRCDDITGAGEECFRCTQPCTELDNKSNAPIMFTVLQEGGDTQPATQIVLSDRDGRARGQIRVDDCSVPIAVRAQVVGRPDTAVDFAVTCVDPVSSFACDESGLPLGREPIAISRIPAAPGDSDFVALLYDTGMNASVEVRNPLRPGATRTIEFPNETARAIRGFSYELGTRPQDRARPALAVVTSRPINAKEQVHVYVYEWVNGDLIPQDGFSMANTPGTPMTRDCPTWVCDVPMHQSFKLGPNCAGAALACASPTAADGMTLLPSCGMTGDACMCADPAPQPCGCHLAVEFQTEVTINTGDLDNDQRSDLMIATSSDLPITTYFSSEAPSGALYREDGCTCGRYAQAPTTFEVLEFGGPGASALNHADDLVIGAPGGAFVRYGVLSGDGRDLIACGQPSRFGGLVPVRDLAKGRFQCDPFSGDVCDGFEDVVLVAARSLGGGSFDDPGTIRVIYGASEDLSLEDDLFNLPGTNIELSARPLAGEEDPRDPRTAEVGDINFDGLDDLAVLFGSSEEIHVWLGAANRGLGEVTNGINLKKCDGAAGGGGNCSPLRQFTLADFDGNGTLEVAVVCDPTAQSRLRRYDPEVAPQ